MAANLPAAVPQAVPEDGATRLRRFALVARTWWWLIVLCVLAATVISTWRLGHPPYYESDALLYVEVAAGPAGDRLVPAVRGTSSVARLAKSTTVLQEWVTSEDTGTSLSTFVRGIDARPVGDLPLVRILVNGTTPEEAGYLGGQVAQAVLDVASEYGFQVSTLQAPEDRVTQQTAPQARNAALGAWAGLILAGIVIAVVNLPTHRALARRRELPVAGVVGAGRQNETTEDWLARRSPAEVEAYRMLRLAFLRTHRPRPDRPTLACVTGTAPPDAIDKVAHGFASTLAEAGWRTLIVRPVESGPPAEPMERLSPLLDRTELVLRDVRDHPGPTGLVDTFREESTGRFDVIIVAAGDAHTQVATSVTIDAEFVLFVAEDEESTVEAHQLPYEDHAGVHVVYAIRSQRRGLRLARPRKMLATR